MADGRIQDIDLDEFRTDDVNAVFNRCHNHRPRLEVRVRRPRARELRRIGCGIHVKIPDFSQFSSGDIRQRKHPQTRTVVGLEKQIPNHILVVINGCQIRKMFANQHRITQVLHVKNQGSRVHALVLLIEFIAEQQVLVVFRQPALVGVGVIVIRDAHRGNVAGIRGIQDGELVRVGSENDGFASKVAIGPIVDHPLRIVGVPCFAVIPHQNRRYRIRQIKRHDAAASEVGAHGVEQPRPFIDDDVVRIGKGVQPCGRFQGRREFRQFTQLIQIQDLQSVPIGLRHDVSMIGVHFHVSPRARRRLSGHKRCQKRHCGIAEVNNGQSLTFAHQRILHARHRVGPAPHVICAGAVEVGIAHRGQQRHSVARKSIGKASLAGGLAPNHNRTTGGRGGD